MFVSNNVGVNGSSKKSHFSTSKVAIFFPETLYVDKFAGVTCGCMRKVV